MVDSMKEDGIEYAKACTTACLSNSILEPVKEIPLLVRRADWWRMIEQVAEVQELGVLRAMLKKIKGEE